VTVLNDGKVLIAGGIGANGQVLSSAELFDPRTGAFSPAGSMHTPRFRHTATLLADGSVLIAGGYNAAALDTAEIFFPAGSTFPVNNGFVDVARRMAATRAYHTATALQDGSVLLCGGLSNGLVLDTAEVFVPTPFAAQLGQFVSGGGTGLLWRMSTARFRHTATLLPNGQVLIAGGKDNALRTLNTAEVFKPSQVLALSSFSAAAQLTEGRADHSATLLPDGSVLIAGGSASNQAASTTAEIYRSGRFSRTRSRLSNSRSSHAAVLLSDGTVILANGDNGNEVLRSAEIYTARP
jgi:WD40 repeat protein